MIQKKQVTYLLVFCVTLLLASCSDTPDLPTITDSPIVSVVSDEIDPTETPTLTPFSPSATPEESAAIVNGELIPLAEYEAEMARFRAASETGIMTLQEDDVLGNLIDQVLLAQAARDAGFVVDDSVLQARIHNLGLSDQELENWILENGYTQESFEKTLTRSIEAAWMRDQIASQTPSTTEQVHARQILLYNLTEAEEVYAQLESGTDFGTLAAEYNPLTQGDLGWFPRGYLTVTELDDYVFALEPEAFTPIIETPLGYHIVQLLEHSLAHPLTPDAYRFMQTQVLKNWLAEQRNQSEIVINLP